ncbi:MAG: hypothetical protein A3D92_21030 [Bacteroidetes bacterium RIFCSPHIGHO2_02_FULL_44_7]|nr:MAG: hypothetical protein A3D92_21030 [Bacteroidetes bacterium RIFCSPHIGHO2_02_FULL_44_7]
MRVQSIFLCGLFLLAGVSRVSAQLIPLGFDTLQHAHEITMDGGIDYYGSSVERDLLSKFIRGGMITEEIKDNSFDRHKAINRFGAFYGGEIEYHNFNKHIFKKKNWGYVIKAGYQGFAGILYSKDLFGLAMYGNERYLGTTIDISGSDISAMTFQKVGFGLIDGRTKSSVVLNIYNVSSAVSGDFRTFKIVQDAEGDQISLEMDAEVMMRNSAKFNQGLGVGLDLDFRLPVAWGKDRQAYIRFQAQNVGFAYMYEPQKFYSIDTTFTFSGLTFNQLIGDNSLISDSTFCILDTLGFQSSTRYKTYMLPGFLQIGKIVDEHYDGKLQSFFGLRLYPTLIYSPYIFAGMDYHPADWVRLGINAGYGGFGKFRAGLYTDFRFGKYSVGVSSENLLGFFWKKASGQSLFFRLRCAF